MQQSDLKNILEIMRGMAQIELSLAQFYKICAETMPREKEFWTSIMKQEQNHAISLKKMFHIISSKPERFEKGRNFNIVAINTFLKGIQSNTEKTREKKVSPLQILYMARDIESALLENKISEVVKTDDIEYQSLTKSVITQTASHKNAISSKIKEYEAS